LRYVLLVVLVGLGVHSLVPRAVAYWHLHSAATDFANYGLCMVGPTGPDLLQERPEEFWRLARRRLVASDPDGKPFARCVESLGAFEAERERKVAHEASAQQFREYEGIGPTFQPSLSLSDLVVTTQRLEQLVSDSSPFSRVGFAPLVRPSRNARAVPHPVSLPAPGLGKGLPASSVGHGSLLSLDGATALVTGRDANLSAYLSRDGGFSWTPADTQEPRIAAAGGRCSVAENEPSFQIAFDERRMRVESWLGGSLETSFPVTSADRTLLDVSCDNAAVLIATGDVEGGDLTLHLCKHVNRCRDLSLPEPLAGARARQRSFSLARVKGVMVLAMARGGIVRVISSRDDGESWTPSTVAYDRHEYSEPERSWGTPTRLLALGERVLLYAGSPVSGQRYSALVSEDFGASWRTR
jgi:hypothetical protein